MGPSAALHVVRPRGLLRRFAEQARDEPLPQVAAPHHPIVRARRGLGLLLSRRADGGQPPGALRRGGGAPLRRAGRATLTWAPWGVTEVAPVAPNRFTATTPGACDGGTDP